MDLSELYEKVASRIKFLRKQQNLTQEKLAELSGISVDYLGKIEANIDKPGFRGLHKIITGLNISYSEFYKEIWFTTTFPVNLCDKIQ